MCLSLMRTRICRSRRRGTTAGGEALRTAIWSDRLPRISRGCACEAQQASSGHLRRKATLCTLTTGVCQPGEDTSRRPLRIVIVLRACRKRFCSAQRAFQGQMQAHMPIVCIFASGLCTLTAGVCLSTLRMWLQRGPSRILHQEIDY